MKVSVFISNPDLSVNFMAAKKSGYLKAKIWLLWLFAKIV